MSTFCRITGKSRGLPKSNYFPLLPPISPADAKRFCRVTGKSYGLPAHHYIPVLVTTKPKKKAAQVPIPVEGHENGLLTKSHVHVADYRYVFPVCEDSSDLLQMLEGKNIESNAHYIYKVAERRCNLVFPARMEAAVRDGEIKNVMLAKDSDTLLLRLKNSGDVAIDVKDIDINGLELYDGEGPSEEAVNERRKRKKHMNSLITALGKVVREKEIEANIYEEEEREREIKRAKEMEERKNKKENKTGQVNGFDSENKIENSHVNGNGEYNKNEMQVNENVNESNHDFTIHNGNTIGYEVGNEPPQNGTKQKKYFVNNVEVKPQNWNDFKNDPADIITKASSQELGPLFENNDWSELDKNTLHRGHPVADKMPTPCVLEPEIVDLSTSLPGLIQAPTVISNTVGFEVTSAVHPVAPLTEEPDKQLLDSIKNLGPAELLKTADANEIFSKDILSVNMLPTVSEVLEVLGKLGKGVVSTIGDSNSDVSGLKVDIREASKFIVGLTVSTPTGDIFVPGQTVHTPNGDQFIPGFTVKTADGVPQLLPGQILQVVDSITGAKRPTFVAGQILNTREGEKFVPGQVIETKEGKKFVPGQTVHAPHSLQFIPGQICTGETPEDTVFVPGLTELDCVGHKFVPGQMSTNQKGQLEFMPGQCEFTGEGWNFVPGQTVISTNGELKFVPGQTIDSKDGPTFVPGQSVKDKYGETNFVPGVVVEGEKGPKFVPGAAIKTPGGQQFVEGQLFRSSSGKVTFIPGVTEVSEQGIYEFAAARVVKDIVYRDSMSLGISIDNAAINTTDKADTIYGHIVQTVQGVEFFPGVASGLPAGKVVPGRLVRGKEVKFVPGLLIDDKFVPGQVVSTEKGDQFVPGQVVETKYGPKFVPGQIVETRSGPKFVPGQTVETDDGPKFVPGQIVETRAGPTFIPGQVIHTDDEGSKFVPGQVVETIEGPRFVPGRVVETGDKVSFVPGQVVETAEGLRFIAPDLENDSEGDVQFTVQGFEITPEELGLLRPNMGSNSIFAPASGETTIDSRMMRQLSEAGMAVGRQVPADIPVVDVKVIPAMGLACSLRDRLPGSIDPVTTIKLSQVLATVASLDWSIPLNGSDLIDNAKEGMIVKSLLKAAAMTNNDIDRFRNINTALEAALLSENKEEIITLVDNLHKFLVSSPILEPLRPKKKVVILKDIIVNNSYNEQEIVDKLSYILNDTDEPIVEGFKNFSKGNPDIVGKIVQRMTDSLDKIETEKDASDALQRAIREVVRESSEISVQEVLHHATSENVKNMFLEAIGLAKAMGLRDVAHTLMDAIADPKRAELLVNDRVTFEILRRLTVMRHLADKRPKFNTALLQLKTDPDEAKSDPLVRELVRESGALMIIPEDNAKIQTAQDVPMSLLVNNNSLAMEDFMLKNKKTGILVILKHGFQCVVPREASKLVLTGKVPYTVLDDTGLTMFAPMHVFSALHIPKVYANRFTMYSVVEEEEPATLSTLTPATSTDEVRTSP